jgi:hypothetical protein
MEPSGGVARAVIVLVVAGRPIPVGAVDATTRCDIELVERLLHLRLDACRAGCSMHLVAVQPELRDLLQLAGFSESLQPLRPYSSMRGGRPNSGNSAG